MKAAIPSLEISEPTECDYLPAPRESSATEWLSTPSMVSHTAHHPPPLGPHQRPLDGAEEDRSRMLRFSPLQPAAQVQGEGNESEISSSEWINDAWNKAFSFVALALAGSHGNGVDEAASLLQSPRNRALVLSQLTEAYTSRRHECARHYASLKRVDSNNNAQRPNSSIGRQSDGSASREPSPQVTSKSPLNSSTKVPLPSSRGLGGAASRISLDASLGLKTHIPGGSHSNGDWFHATHAVSEVVDSFDVDEKRRSVTATGRGGVQRSNNGLDVEMLLATESGINAPSSASSSAQWSSAARLRSQQSGRESRVHAVRSRGAGEGASPSSNHQAEAYDDDDDFHVTRSTLSSMVRPTSAANRKKSLAQGGNNGVTTNVGVWGAHNNNSSNNKSCTSQESSPESAAKSAIVKQLESGAATATALRPASSKKRASPSTIQRSGSSKKNSVSSPAERHRHMATQTDSLLSAESHTLQLTPRGASGTLLSANLPYTSSKSPRNMVLVPVRVNGGNSSNTSNNAVAKGDRSTSPSTGDEAVLEDVSGEGERPMQLLTIVKQVPEASNSNNNHNNESGRWSCSDNTPLAPQPTTLERLRQAKAVAGGSGSSGRRFGDSSFGSVRREEAVQYSQNERQGSLSSNSVGDPQSTVTASRAVTTKSEENIELRKDSTTQDALLTSNSSLRGEGSMGRKLSLAERLTHALEKAHGTTSDEKVLGGLAFLRKRRHHSSGANQSVNRQRAASASGVVPPANNTVDDIVSDFTADDECDRNSLQALIPTSSATQPESCCSEGPPAAPLSPTAAVSSCSNQKIVVHGSAYDEPTKPAAVGFGTQWSKDELLASSQAIAAQPPLSTDDGGGGKASSTAQLLLQSMLRFASVGSNGSGDDALQKAGSGDEVLSPHNPAQPQQVHHHVKETAILTNDQQVIERREKLMFVVEILYVCMSIALTLTSLGLATGRVGVGSEYFSEGLTRAEVAIDVFTFLLQCSNFFIAVEVKGNIRSDVSFIVQSYLADYRRVVFDVLTTFPLSLVLLLSGYGDSDFLRVNVILRPIHLHRMFDRLKVLFHINIHPSAWRLLKYAVDIGVITTVMTCGLLLYIRMYDGVLTGASWFQVQYTNPTIADIYILVWYQTLQCITDKKFPYPQTDGEFIIGISVLFISICAFLIVIASVEEIIVEFIEMTGEKTEKIDHAMEIMEYMGLPEDLQEEVAVYYDRMYKHFHSFDFTAEDDLFEDLPEDLRRDILYETNARVIRSIPIFASVSADDAFIDGFVTELQECFVSPGAPIIIKGEEGDCMFFLHAGDADILDAADDSTVIFTLTSGSYFGEVAMLFGWKRSNTIVARTACSLYVITSNQFDAIIETYPEILEGILKSAVERSGGKVPMPSSIADRHCNNKMRREAGARSEVRESDGDNHEGVEDEEEDPDDSDDNVVVRDENDGDENETDEHEPATKNPFSVPDRSHDD